MLNFGKTIFTLAVLAGSLLGASNTARADHEVPRFDEFRDRGLIDRQDAVHMVRLFYRAFLFREAEQEGLRHHVRYIMENGEEGLFITARNFALSPEFQQNIQGRVMPRDIVNNIYRVLFRRVPDPAAQGWVRMIRQGQAGAVAEGIVRSEEFRQLYLY